MEKPNAIEALLRVIRESLPNIDLVPVESAVTSWLRQFELGPRQDMEAHAALLENLNQQIIELETRLTALEAKEN